MKTPSQSKNVFSFTLLLAVLFLSNSIVAQQNQTDEWIRVQSDNKEFSIEFPAKYDLYGDQDGFALSHNKNTYRLSEMRMLNSYQNKTLLSLEIYRTDLPKHIVEVFADSDERKGKQSEIKIGESKFKQVLMKEANYYAVRRYFASKDYIYILTAASREGETDSIKRFLESIYFTAPKIPIEPAQTNNAPVRTFLISELKASTIQIEPATPFVTNSKNKNVPLKQPERDANETPLIIFVKPLPAYTDAARNIGENGIIRFRLNFSDNGSLSKMQLLSTLDGGLTRQALYAALRTKFLPQEKDGKPVSVVKVIEYSFRVY